MVLINPVLTWVWADCRVGQTMTRPATAADGHCAKTCAGKRIRRSRMAPPVAISVASPIRKNK